jgi:predicted HTH domain antitoxin
MNPIVVKLKLPADVVLALQSSGLDREQIEIRARRDFAVQLFADGRLSLGKAAKLAEMNKYDFWMLLVEKDISPFHYTQEDFDADMEVMNRWVPTTGEGE